MYCHLLLSHLTITTKVNSYSICWPLSMEQVLTYKWEDFRTSLFYPCEWPEPGKHILCKPCSVNRLLGDILPLKSTIHFQLKHFIFSKFICLKTRSSALNWADYSHTEIIKCIPYRMESICVKVKFSTKMYTLMARVNPIV